MKKRKLLLDYIDLDRKTLAHYKFFNANFDDIISISVENFIEKLKEA